MLLVSGGLESVEVSYTDEQIETLALNLFIFKKYGAEFNHSRNVSGTK